MPLTRCNSFPITAPAMPCRGIGIGGSEIHEFVAGSYASTAPKAPTGSFVVTSPPATSILPPSVPPAPPYVDPAATLPPGPAAASRRHPFFRSTPHITYWAVLLHHIRVGSGQ